MKETKRTLSFLSISLLFLSFLAGAAFFLKGCGQAQVASDEVAIGYIASDQMHHPALMVIKEKRLLEKAGFKKVTWLPYMNGANAMQAMSVGDIDFACCGIVPIMSAHAQDGMKLAIIAGSNQEGTGLVVNHSIQSIDDLNNKIIASPGMSSIQQAMLSRLADDHGITIRNQTAMVSDMSRLLQGGLIDGFIAWEPHPTNAVGQGLGHELLTSHDIMPGHQCCVFVTTSSALQDDPETVKKVLATYHDAYQWFLDNQDESVKMMSKATGVSEPTIRKALETVVCPEAPDCDMESMHDMAEFLIKNGTITTVKPDEIDAFLDSLHHPGGE